MVINRESINDALITVRLLFAKLDSRRNRAVVFDRSDTFQLIDTSRATTRGKMARGVGYVHVRIEGNKRSEPFPCIRYFFIRPVVHLLRENRLRDFSTLRSGGGTRKTRGESRKSSAGRGTGCDGRTMYGCAWTFECEAA